MYRGLLTLLDPVENSIETQRDVTYCEATARGLVYVNFSHWHDGSTFQFSLPAALHCESDAAYLAPQSRLPHRHGLQCRESVVQVLTEAKLSALQTCAPLRNLSKI